jgi:hypothetical protein
MLRTREDFDINCTDPLGRTALSIAIINENPGRTAASLLHSMIPGDILAEGLGVTKRCRLSLLTKTTPNNPVQRRGGGGCGVSANEHSCAHHATCSQNKLWRSTSIFNLWLNVIDKLYSSGSPNSSVGPGI